MGRVTGFELTITMICINFGLFFVGLMGNWGVNEFGQTWLSQLGGLLNPNFSILGFPIPGVMALATMIAGVAIAGIILSKTTGAGIGILAYAGIFWGSYALAAVTLWMMPWAPVKAVVVLLTVICMFVFFMDIIEMSSG